MEEKRTPMHHLSLLFLFLLFLSSSVTKTVRSDHDHDHDHSPPIPRGGDRKHFVLVHGACHGAWSWYKVSSLLRSSGHNVTALDMAASGIDPRQAEGLRSFTEYVQPLMDFMAKVESKKKVILVGHSQGGLVISKAMEHFPDKISVAVFVTAAMPGPTLNVSTLLREFRRRIDFGPDTRYTFSNGPENPPTTLVFGPLFSASKLYQKSPEEDLTLAKTLMRPTHLFGEEEWNKGVLHLTAERYGSVKRVFVVTEKDEVIKKEFQRWVIQRNQPTGVVEIRGSDHMVMNSKPFALFTKLQTIAQHYS